MQHYKLHSRKSIDLWLTDIRSKEEEKEHCQANKEPHAWEVTSALHRESTCTNSVHVSMARVEGQARSTTSARRRRGACVISRSGSRSRRGRLQIRHSGSRIHVNNTPPHALQRPITAAHRIPRRLKLDRTSVGSSPLPSVEERSEKREDVMREKLKAFTVVRLPASVSLCILFRKSYTK